jgi:hypothetical protein
MKGKTPWLIAGLAVVLVLIIAGAYALLNPPRPTPLKPAATVAVAPPAAPAVAPQPPIPFSYASKARGVEVSLRLPQALADTPELHERLYRDEVAGLRSFAKESAGGQPLVGGPYQNDVAWTITAQTDKLLSLESTTYLYQGGAHGNTALQSLLWDRSLKAQVRPATLFKAGTNHAKLDALLCRMIADAKKTREGADYNPNDPTWPCPKWAQSTFALAPSDQAGKAGGLIFLFSPYAIGPYADGPFDITVPQQAFHDALAPAYADEFAGKPPKTGDTTPPPS